MLKVSENQRFLTHEDGTPFFYLADTAWELFHRLNYGEADMYLRDRASKGFTVIQAVVLAELNGILGPNAQGDLPLHEQDPTLPDEAYFTHVDAIVAIAASLGLTIAMLPTWGDKWQEISGGIGPVIFTPENACSFGKFLGQRYATAPIIWVLGGDRLVENDLQREILRAMARGLEEGDGGRHLMTFHPPGGHTSQQFFPDEPWLDFHMWQSGHARNRDNYHCIAQDYAATPIKPCVDGEPGYEDHPSSFDLNNGYLDDYDTRKFAYWALFAGAHGHTYGCHPVWQFWQMGSRSYNFVRRPWYEAIHLPGAGQLQYLRSLLESRPFLTRIPDQSLIVSENYEGAYHVQATRDECGSYALIYFGGNKPVTIDLRKLSGTTLNAYWYDPRTGNADFVGQISNDGPREFTVPSFEGAPTCGPDWVLVLDDASVKYPRPGSCRYQETE